MIIVGIDPHITKPYAFSGWVNGQLRKTGKEGSIHTMSLFIKTSDHVYIENQFFGGNSKVLTDLAHSTGKVMGVCELFSIPYTLVMPTVWQSAFGLTGRKPKDISRYKWEKLHAQQICEKASELSGQKIEDDDIASAILIGLYGSNL